MNIATEKDIVLGVFHDRNFMPTLVESVVTGAQFDKPVFGWIVDKSREYYLEYNKAPSRKVFKRLVEKDNSLDESEAKQYYRSIRTLFKKKHDSPAFSLKELEKYSRKQKFVSQLNAAAEQIEGNEDIDVVIDEMVGKNYELEMQKNREWEAKELLSGFEERQAQRKERRDNPQKYKSLNFGIKELDARIKRGLVPGDFAVIAAKTGRGKSIFCHQVGVQGIYQQLGVTHITMENEFDQVMGRYDSRITGVPYDTIQRYDYLGDKKALGTQADWAIEMLRDSIETKLQVVKCLPNRANVMTVYDIIDRLDKREGHKTNLLIVDSPDLMAPLTKFKEYRLQRAAVYWELKALFLERQLMGFGTSQLNRGSDDGMPTPEDMSEAYDKARLLDLMMVLVRSIKQKLDDEASLFISKSRDFEDDGTPILLHTDLSCMLIDVG